MKLKLDLLIQSVTKVIGEPIEVIRSKSRSEHLVYARRIIVHHMSQEGYTNSSICQTINRTHSSVFYMKTTQADEYAFNPKYRKIFDETMRLYESKKNTHERWLNKKGLKIKQTIIE
jgi:chromosomal replication initiation ATPase DnaA